jgi:hypothetical protein
MAVRNLQAIQRQGAMIAERKKNEQNLKKDFFWKCVNICSESRGDAIDAIDTILELNKNGLRNRYEEWEKNQDLRFCYQYNSFVMGDSCDTIQVSYIPSSDSVDFFYNGKGGMEGYSTAGTPENYLIYRIYSRQGYVDKLRLLAECLQPFLDNFFKWVDSL